MSHVTAKVELTIDMRTLAAEAALAAVREQLSRVGLDEVVFYAEQVSDHAFTKALRAASGGKGLAVTCEIDGWKVTASHWNFTWRKSPPFEGEDIVETVAGSSIRCVRLPVPEAA